MSVTDGRVPVTVLEARDALTVVTRIADKKRATFGALWTHRVVETVQADVQLIGFRAGTLRMTVTSALDAAVGPDKSKVTATHVRLETVTVDTTLNNKVGGNIQSDD